MFTARCPRPRKNRARRRSASTNCGAMVFLLGRLLSHDFWPGAAGPKIALAFAPALPWTEKNPNMAAIVDRSATSTPKPESSVCSDSTRTLCSEDHSGSLAGGEPQDYTRLTKTFPPVLRDVGVHRAPPPPVLARRSETSSTDRRGMTRLPVPAVAMPARTAAARYGPRAVVGVDLGGTSAAGKPTAPSHREQEPAALHAGGNSSPSKQEFASSSSLRAKVDRVSVFASSSRPVTPKSPAALAQRVLGKRTGLGSPLGDRSPASDRRKSSSSSSDPGRAHKNPSRSSTASCMPNVFRSLGGCRRSPAISTEDDGAPTSAGGGPPRGPSGRRTPTAAGRPSGSSPPPVLISAAGVHHCTDDPHASEPRPRRIGTASTVPVLAGDVSPAPISPDPADPCPAGAMAGLSPTGKTSQKCEKRSPINDSAAPAHLGRARAGGISCSSSSTMVDQRGGSKRTTTSSSSATDHGTMTPSAASVVLALTAKNSREVTNKPSCSSIPGSSSSRPSSGGLSMLRSRSKISGGGTTPSSSGTSRKSRGGGTPGPDPPPANSRSPDCTVARERPLPSLPPQPASSGVDHDLSESTRTRLPAGVSRFSGTDRSDRERFLALNAREVQAREYPMRKFNLRTSVLAKELGLLKPEESALPVRESDMLVSWQNTRTQQGGARLPLRTAQNGALKSTTRRPESARYDASGFSLDSIPFPELLFQASHPGTPVRHHLRRHTPNQLCQFCFNLCSSTDIAMQVCRFGHCFHLFCSEQPDQLIYDGSFGGMQTWWVFLVFHVFVARHLFLVAQEGVVGRQSCPLSHKR